MIANALVSKKVNMREAERNLPRKEISNKVSFGRDEQIPRKDSFLLPRLPSDALPCKSFDDACCN